MIVDGPGPCTRDGNRVFGAQNHVDGLFLPPNCCQSVEIGDSIGLTPFFFLKNGLPLVALELLHPLGRI